MAINTDDISKKYQDLLIVQYNDKPKARATIDAVVKQILADGIYWDVQNGYDIETAVGKQQDILGKYIGVDRLFNGLVVPADAFAMNNYGEGPEGFGMGDVNDPAIEGGSLQTYFNLVSGTQKLSNNDYRILQKLKIIVNNSNLSTYEIITSLSELFDGKVKFTDNYNMTINYFVDPSILSIIKIAATKDCLPRPIGVGVNIFEQNEYFSFAQYGKEIADDAFGMGDCNNASIDGGSMLSY